MKAPDKIYIHRTIHLGLLSASEIDITGQDEQYIRKDIVDEMIKSAEDHAYFAGQENLREKLQKWVKEKQAHFRRRAGDISDLSNPDKPFFDGKEKAFTELIDKIESL